MNRLAVVILNWNGLDDTRECLESLHEQSFKKFDIIVIDNGSSEAGTADFLQELENDTRITLLKNTVNKGFAGGVNTGIRYAMNHGYEHVALLNNDAVVDKDWLKELVATSKQQNSGITTGLLLHRDGKTIDSTGDYCSNWGLPFPRNRGDKTSKAPESNEVFSGSGGGSLYSIAMFKQIGLFDETFFAYYEDTDISFRAQLYGYTVYYTNQAIAYHKQGATSSKIPGFTVQQTFKNLPLFFVKNMPGSLFWTVGVKFCLAYVLMFGNAIKKGSGGVAIKGFAQSIWLVLTHALPARIKIQNARVASVNDIQAKLWPDLPPDQTGLRKFRQFFTGKP